MSDEEGVGTCAAERRCRGIHMLLPERRRIVLVTVDVRCERALITLLELRNECRPRGRSNERAVDKDERTAHEARRISSAEGCPFA